VLSFEADRYLRLRVVNGANARFFKLRLEGGDAHVLAHDGQPIEPTALGGEALELAPGQRVDLLVPPGTQPLALTSELDGRRVEIAKVLRSGRLPQVPPALPVLEPNPLPSYFNYAALRHATFTIEGGKGGGLKEAKLDGVLLPAAALAARGYFWAVNGHAGPSSEPLLTVPAGSTVAVSVDNISRFSHALHLHGHAGALIERAGRPVKDPQWRDTFIIRPLEPAKILFLADNPGRWLMASTIAEHFDSGLQAWFQVT
jgi:FtsP/CotA-like multicopper oxidase with cupredoxin domain